MATKTSPAPLLANSRAKKSTKKETKSSNPSHWKKGQSGNPKGRPKDGMSWAHVIKELGDMTSAEIIQLVGPTSDIGRKLKKLPKGVQMKYIVGARAFATLATTVQHGLFTAIMDRTEGRPAQSVDLTSGGKTLKTYVGVSPDEWEETKDKEGE